MARGEIYLTLAPVRATGTGKQALKDSATVSRWKGGMLILRIVATEGSPSITVRVITGMNTEQEEGWVEVGAWSAQTTVTSVKFAVSDLAKFLRWEVTAFSGTAATFTIEGMLSDV